MGPHRDRRSFPSQIAQAEAPKQTPVGASQNILLKHDQKKQQVWEIEARELKTTTE